MSDSVRKAFEKAWAETYPNDVAYFAQYNDQGLMRDMCRLVAFDIFKAATAAADAEWRGVVEVMRDALELAKPCVKPMRIQAVEAQIDKALAQATELLGRK